MNTRGEMELLAEIPADLPSEPFDFQLCTHRTHGLMETHNYETSAWEYSIIDRSTGHRVELDPGEDQIFCCALWWPGDCDAILAIVQPWLQMGMYCQGMPALMDVETGGLSFFGDTPSYDGVLSVPSPDGTTVAFTQDGQPWIFQRGSGSHALDLQSYGFPMEDADFIRPTWSPDSRQVAWLSWALVEGDRQEGVAIFDLENHSSRFIQPYQVWSGEMPSYLNWSPSGEHLCVETADSRISVLSVEGIEQFSVEPAARSKWSPNGGWLAYSLFDNGTGFVHVRSADGEELNELGPGTPRAWSPDSQSLLFFDYASGYWISSIDNGVAHRVDLPDDADVLGWLSTE